VSTPLPERATVLSLPMDDPEASVRGSPALASLLADGWQVVASVPAARGERTELLLVLAPPRPVPAVRVPREVYLLLALACVTCGAFGALLATIIN